MPPRKPPAGPSRRRTRASPELSDEEELSDYAPAKRRRVASLPPPGTNVAVWWSRDKQWWDAVVLHHLSQTRFQVRYDEDGFLENVDARTRKWKKSDPTTTAAAAPAAGPGPTRHSKYVEEDLESSAGDLDDDDDDGNDDSDEEDSAVAAKARAALRKANRAADADDNNDDVCFSCKLGGNVVCCDTCTRSFHAECHNPPISKKAMDQDADWRCSFCLGNGKDAIVHDKVCYECKKTTAKLLVPCSRCKNSVHSACMDTIPHENYRAVGTYLCRLCEKERANEVETILASKTFDAVNGKKTQMGFFVKLRGQGHIHNIWIPRQDMEVAAKGKVLGFLKREARVPVEGKVNGVRPEWLIAERVIGDRDKPRQYFVKWTDLDYDQSTWEDENVVSERFPEVLTRYKAVATRKKTKRATERPSRMGDYQDETPFLEEGLDLYPYQKEGFNWLRFNWYNRKNVILADEMGLGKTVQTVAYVASLHAAGWRCPHLVVAPFSTIGNWTREFKKWAPQIFSVVYTGSADSRRTIAENEFYYRKTKSDTGGAKNRIRCDVIITTYEQVLADAKEPNRTYTLKGLCPYQSIVVDEGHRLKAGESSKLNRTLAAFKTGHRVLLTGTPLQNNLEELYSLLNYLQPEDFPLGEKFDEAMTNESVEQLKDRLKPFILRRVKDDVQLDLPPKVEVTVPVPMTKMQMDCYRAILQKNYDVLREGAKRGIKNVLMELRKCCNHAGLVADMDEYMTTANYLLSASGKMALLDAMLVKLKASSHRVLVFSQFKLMLNVLEDYVNDRGYLYERIDGDVSGVERQARIDRFNDSSKNKFLFLLSTRAGGLGINLATADTVIIYDSDFNPQMDLQALARAHRIGQKSKLVVYRFVTQRSVEERILQRAQQKLRLNEAIVERLGQAVAQDVDLADIVRHGAAELLSHSSSGVDDQAALEYDDAGVDKLLDRSALGVDNGNDANTEDKNNTSLFQSFDVASLWKQKQSEEQAAASAAAAATEVKQTEEARTNVEFWDTLLKARVELAEQRKLQSMGRGKRERKRINYQEGSPQEKEANREQKKLVVEDVSKTNGFRRLERETIIRHVLKTGLHDFKAAHVWTLLESRFRRMIATKGDLTSYLRRLLIGCAEPPSSDPFFRDGLPKDILIDLSKQRELMAKVVTVSLVRRKVIECVVRLNKRLDIDDYNETGIHDAWKLSELGKDNPKGVAWDRRASDARLLLASLRYGISNYSGIVCAVDDGLDVFPSWTCYEEYARLCRNGEESSEHFLNYERELQDILRRRLLLLVKALTVEASAGAGDFVDGYQYKRPREASYTHFPRREDGATVVPGEIVEDNMVDQVVKPVYTDVLDARFEVILKTNKDSKAVAVVRAQQVPVGLLQEYYAKVRAGLPRRAESAGDDSGSDYSPARTTEVGDEDEVEDEE